MCYRFALEIAEPELETLEFLSILENVKDLKNSGDKFPKNQIQIIHQKLIKSKTWGFIPHWKKDLNNPQFYARCETIFEKPYFKDSILNRRCVVPMSYYYEYSKEKIPHRFSVVKNKLLFAAAIGSSIKISRDDIYSSVAIITKESEGEVKNIHPRMPKFLTEDDLKIWGERLSNQQIGKILNRSNDFLSFTIDQQKKK